MGGAVGRLVGTPHKLRRKWAAFGRILFVKGDVTRVLSRVCPSTMLHRDIVAGQGMGRKQVLGYMQTFNKTSTPYI